MNIYFSEIDAYYYESLSVTNSVVPFPEKKSRNLSINIVFLSYRWNIKKRMVLTKISFKIFDWQAFRCYNISVLITAADIIKIKAFILIIACSFSFQ